MSDRPSNAATRSILKLRITTTSILLDESRAPSIARPPAALLLSSSSRAQRCRGALTLRPVPPGAQPSRALTELLVPPVPSVKTFGRTSSANTHVGGVARAVNGYRGRGMFGDRGNPPSQGGPTALGDLLKRRRLALGFSRTRVGELSQINASTIEAWETGRVAKPPIHDVMRLARAL